ncbi:TonB-dependent receptor [uncultured Alistipes sp.]|uniref:TonB-dependent receptor n=1 Tax=uncultured Alistipes sp. TaxID=538949 RepID=UPI0025F65A5C|nr:TonB-dependent receptor [uncultured Alistipes sp.]
MEQVISAIERQTRYLFGIDDEVNTDLPVTVHAENEPLKKVLDEMFRGTDIIYTVEGTNILLTRRPAAPQSRAVSVTGRVTDASGQPIVGASVIVRGTTVGVSTDTEGRFALEVPSPVASQTLEVSYLGYETAAVPVGSRTSFEVTLQESSSEIEQVVVTALGIKRQEKALSYNVQQVAASDITLVKDANFMNSLSGKVAGVTINASSSGVGGATKVVLRGNKSISQSSNALYVIDGIPMYNFGGGGGTEFDSRGATEAIADINPEDIESISVLTGAAAAALYGSEAANGAVMITTKKGEAGALKVTLTSNTEFLNPFVLPEFQNRYGTGLNGVRSGSNIYSWGERLAPSARYGYTPNDFFETGHVYTNAFTLSGGTDRNQTYFSAAAVNSDGIIPNNEYDRYNFTFRNTSFFLKDKLRIDASASYIYQQDQNMTNQGVYSNPLVSAYLFPRGENFDLYRRFERYNEGTKLMEQFWSADMEGGDLRMQNPYWIAYRNLRNTDKKRYMLSFTASYDILPWLNVTGRVRVDNSNSLYTQKLYASTNTTITDGGKNGHYTEARTYDSQTYADVMANINKTFGDDWSLQANIGASINNVKSDELSYRGPIQENGLPNVFNVFDLDDTKKRAEKTGWHDQTQSLFASVEVGWKQMLYLTVTGRNDWASQIAGSSSSSFFYPSVGLSWVPTSLWDLGGALSYLKLRGSIASVGMPFPRYLTVPTYEYDATNRVWKDKTHYPIGDLKPERTTTYEVGIDARLWRHLSLSASWYQADTKNQTFDPSLPPSSSYTTIYLQTGHVRNTGVELSVGYDNRWGSFRWATNFTYAWNRNEIIELAANAVNPVTGEPLNLEKLDIKGLGKAKYILKEGGTLGDLYTTSDLRFNDNGYVEVDKSGNLLLTDEGDDIYLGSVFPDHNLAWRNDFSWKGVNLGLLFTARIGGICYSATQANLDLYGVSEASAAARDAGGVLINGREMVDAQKWYQAIGSQSGLPQYYTYSATNFRLQELSLGYTLPAKWFRDKMRMTVSFVGRNLWMIYCKAPFDPEAVASTGLNYQGIDYFMMPSLRSLGFSVKFQF